MYTEKLKEIMSEIALFYNVFNFPMSNGINFKTQFFKENLSFDDFSSYFDSKSPDAYKFYQSVEAKIGSFKEALSEFVAQDDFIDKWDVMSEKERNFLTYFDQDSYIILRNKLPKENIFVIDWKELFNAIKPEWDKEFSTKLDLPIEFVSPPENRLQALKQKKALIQNGYNEETVQKIYESLDINKDAMAKGLLALVAERNGNVEELCDKFKVDIPYYISYQIGFMEEQEKRITSSNKPKM